jgi:hypothetical protein
MEVMGADVTRYGSVYISGISTFLPKAWADPEKTPKKKKASDKSERQGYFFKAFNCMG